MIWIFAHGHGFFIKRRSGLSNDEKRQFYRESISPRCRRQAASPHDGRSTATRRRFARLMNGNSIRAYYVHTSSFLSCVFLASRTVDDDGGGGGDCPSISARKSSFAGRARRRPPTTVLPSSPSPSSPLPFAPPFSPPVPPPYPCHAATGQTTGRRRSYPDDQTSAPRKWPSIKRR